MEDIPLEELIATLTKSDFKDQVLFLEFQYDELKDMLSSFLTLITATFVLSLTFSDKIIDFSSANKKQKTLLHISWGFLIVSVGLCGYALNCNYLAAESAIKEMASLPTNKSFHHLNWWSNFLQKAASITYSIGLTLLFLSTAFRGKKNTTPESP